MFLKRRGLFHNFEIYTINSSFFSFPFCSIKIPQKVKGKPEFFVFYKKKKKRKKAGIKKGE